METHRHTKDWLTNLASSTQLCKKNMRKKSALALFMLRLGTANHTDDTITLNDFAVTA